MLRLQNNTLVFLSDVKDMEMSIQTCIYPKLNQSGHESPLHSRLVLQSRFKFPSHLGVRVHSDERGTNHVLVVCSIHSTFYVLPYSPTPRVPRKRGTLRDRRYVLLLKWSRFFGCIHDRKYNLWNIFSPIRPIPNVPGSSDVVGPLVRSKVKVLRNYLVLL